MRELIRKYSATDKVSVSQLQDQLVTISDQTLKLNCLVELVKVNKQAELSSSLLQIIEQNVKTEPRLCGKLTLLSILKMPKKPSSEQDQNTMRQFQELLAGQDTPLQLKLYICKAFVARAE